MEKYIVHIEEEYGYRDWVWSPDMTVDELKVWWESLPTVAPYFFEGPVSFPGEVHQICFHYEDGEELLTKPPSYSLVEEVEGRTVIPLHPNPLKMPEDIIRMHIHEDSDSYLIIDGVGYNHAGYVEYDDYNDEAYESAPEVKDAWDKALYEDMTKKFGEPKEDKE